jgi:hypothetical protein
MKGNAILKICQVIDVYDETDGERIKVRLSPQDDKLTDDKIPYAYPLLPKLLHIKPKIGELVLIVLTKPGDGYSNRYYIGPIISQPQYMEKDDLLVNAMSLYPGSEKLPDPAPSLNPDSHGSFAKNDDIALYGRKKTDIILTNDDVRIRCGSRTKDISSNDIVFNRTDPAYIHLKHSDNLRGEKDKEYRSTATVVADKINLISHQSNTPFRTNDKDNLISDDEMQKIIKSAHQLPYGDVLVDFLKLFVKTFVAHSHPYPYMSPLDVNGDGTTLKGLTEYNFDKMLSESVRIN